MTVNRKHKKIFLTVDKDEEYNKFKQKPKKSFAEFKF